MKKITQTTERTTAQVNVQLIDKLAVLKGYFTNEKYYEGRGSRSFNRKKREYLGQNPSSTQ